MARAAHAAVLALLLGGCAASDPPTATVDASAESGDASGDAPEGGQDIGAVCDAGGACCCDIDVLVDPTCADGGLVCPASYVLLPASACDKCVRREPDAATGG